MIKVNYFLYSKLAILDEITKNVSVINVIDQLSATRFPATTSESAVVSLLSRDISKDKEKYSGHVFGYLNDEKIAGSKIDIDFLGKKRNRLIIRFPPLILKTSGTLRFEIIIDDMLVSSIDIEVNQKPTQKPKVK